jgi:hypothetical protein
MIEMEVPAELQERIDILFQEHQSELGKDAANQFVLWRSAIHYKDDEFPALLVKEWIRRGGSKIRQNSLCQLELL